MAYDDSLELMVKYLLNMQFYCENADYLYSRDTNTKIPIPGISTIMQRFADDILEHLHLIVKQQYHDFLVEVAKKLPIPVEKIERQFWDNIHELDLSELTDLLAVNFLVGPTRETLQKRMFDELIGDLKRKAIGIIGTPNAEQIVQERLEALYAQTDSVVSMLYNLVLLEFLANKYGTKSVIEHVTELVDKYSSRIVQKLTEK